MKPRLAQANPAAGSRLLGPLETQVIEHLWTLAGACTVREVSAAFPNLAYTTLMTTLDRLHRKGVVLRMRDGRAFSYQPRCSREEWLGELAMGHVAEWLAASNASQALLSTLVRAVGSRDAALLDELDALIRAERERLAEHERRDVDPAATHPTAQPAAPPAPGDV